MRTYLMTRGLGRDYVFLGSPPAEPWWREFGQFTAFEQPTLLVHGNDTGWRVYASAIPTTRHDRVNTLIRLSLVLAGDHPRSAAASTSSDGAVTNELVNVLTLIQSWLDGPTAAASEELATLLDKKFPADDTERFISTVGADNDDEVNRRVESVLNDLRNRASRSHDSVDPALVKPGSWLGDVNVPDVRAAFVHRVQALLLGDHRGWAVQLNLAGEAEIRSYFERQHEPLVALLEERVPGGLRELRPKALTPPAHPSRRTVSRTRVAVAIAALLLIGLVGLIVWLLTYSQPPPPTQPTPTPTQPTPQGPPQPIQLTSLGPPFPQPSKLILPNSSTSGSP